MRENESVIELGDNTFEHA